MDGWANGGQSVISLLPLVAGRAEERVCRADGVEHGIQSCAGRERGAISECFIVQYRGRRGRRCTLRNKAHSLPAKRPQTCSWSWNITRTGSPVVCGSSALWDGGQIA
jgi:hypothetical protein